MESCPWKSAFVRFFNGELIIKSEFLIDIKEDQFIVWNPDSGYFLNILDLMFVNEAFLKKSSQILKPDQNQ